MLRCSRCGRCGHDVVPKQSVGVNALRELAVGQQIGLLFVTLFGLLMLATLRHCNHHKERTAAVLGISLKTLYNRLKEYAAEEGGTTVPGALEPRRND